MIIDLHRMVGIPEPMKDDEAKLLEIEARLKAAKEQPETFLEHAQKDMAWLIERVHSLELSLDETIHAED